MEISLTLREPRRRAELFGAGDRYLRRIKQTFGVRIDVRGDAVRLHGEPQNVSQAANVIEHLQTALRSRPYLEDADVDEALASVAATEQDGQTDALASFNRGVLTRPRTAGQRAYVEAMLERDLVFCLGPAGTGKTYLAVAVAVHLLKLGRIKRIVLVRPAVEAGERLGFLPGDMQAKVNPYLRPLLDAMHDMMTYEQLKRFMLNDVVEVAPLAYMRGRTLNHSCVILDEAQNATPSQMLMFLTRLGNESRMIVTGDDSQVDLEPGQSSGLVDAVRKLRDTPGLSILRLQDVDIVRHPLVARIVNRYAAPVGDSAQTQRPPSAMNDTTQTADPSKPRGDRQADDPQVDNK